LTVNIPPPAAHLSEGLSAVAAAVEQTLTALLTPPQSAAPQLWQAMRYAALAGGKRLRPFLVVQTAKLCGVSGDPALRTAAAVEMVHAYSLAHDDLPAMDDDDLRRGQPTVHRKFDEATAILAADALQPLAFSVLAALDNVPADMRVTLVALVAEACGSIGMTGGQSIDLAAEGKTLSAEDLEHMYSLKTGALINASVVSACFLADDRPQQQFEALDNFSRAIGIAFQIRDDILDVEGETHVIGKPAGSDAGLNKATYPLLFGVDVSRKRCEELLESAVEHLKVFGRSAESLRWLASYITERGH